MRMDRPALLFAALGPFVWTAAGSAGCRGDSPDRAAPDAAAPVEAGPARLGGSMILATTTSTRDSGLLDVLVPEFERRTGVQVKVIAVGTGAALAMAARGDADAVLVHAPTSERKHIERGDLTAGRLVMHNDFMLVGPPEDPAGVRGAKSLAAAMQAIAARGTFVSRGDDSGTHKKELELWQAAGVDLKAARRREETGQGMGATLHVADQRRGYTLTDRGTYLALRRRLQLDVVLQGDPRLLNVYHVHVVSPIKHPRVKHPQAAAFTEFLVSPEAQRRIADFGRSDFGEPLFFADGGKTDADIGAGAPPPAAPEDSAPPARREGTSPRP